MNKKLISKCVGSSINGECNECPLEGMNDCKEKRDKIIDDQEREVIEEPQPIQKEEVKTATEMMINDMQEEEYYRIKHKKELNI